MVFLPLSYLRSSFEANLCETRKKEANFYNQICSTLFTPVWPEGGGWGGGTQVWEQNLDPHFLCLLSPASSFFREVWVLRFSGWILVSVDFQVLLGRKSFDVRTSESFKARKPLLLLMFDWSRHNRVGRGKILILCRVSLLKVIDFLFLISPSLFRSVFLEFFSSSLQLYNIKVSRLSKLIY